MTTRTGGKSYQDFVITVKGAGEDRYHVEAKGPTGEATTTFALPFDDKDIEIFLLKVGHPRRTMTRGRVPVPVRPTVEFGTKLFKAIIKDEVRDIFTNARHDAARGNHGLRVQLRLSAAPELADLPWEFLYDGRRFLALSDTPVVRYLDLQNPPRPMKVAPPLRILVTISAPHDQPRLKVEVEKAKVQQALASLAAREMIELGFATDATLYTLRRTMRQARRRGCPYHVWHYVGHGTFDKGENASVLAFCDKANRSYPVGGFQLGTLFNSFPEMRLALLNACEGARPDPHDPFAGVAAALVECGVPAVIGMQFEISDEAANTLAEEFYESLADGLPVDAALTEARQAVFSLPNWTEWATPVLFMRSPDGQIFDVSAAARPVEVETSREDAKQAQLATLYTEALDAFFTERWERAIELLSEIVARDEDYKDAAGKLAEARRRKTLADLYADARRLHRAQQWPAVVAALERIQALDPAYPDPDGLFASSRAELDAQELATLYNQGLQHMNAGAWSEALKQFEKIRRVDAGYRETEALLARVRRELLGTRATPDLLTITSPIHLELIRVPAGEFLMGSDPKKDKNAQERERPQHSVHVAEFYIGKYPVTETQYAAFVKATGHGTLGKRGQENHPVVNVSWRDAVAFCQWLSQESGRSFRLPTEAEWEKAARGVDGRIYPWGNDWDATRCNTDESGRGGTSPVGQFSPAGDSPYGAADMAGNVWEWCSSLYKPYPYRADDGREDQEASGRRVLRGGSWYGYRSSARCAFRGGSRPDARSDLIGFRLVLAPALPS